MSGQESFEVDDVAFDMERPKMRQGNELFTYALLNALTKPRSDLQVAELARRIDIPWIATYLNGFFKGDNPRSGANVLRAATSE